MSTAVMSGRASQLLPTVTCSSCNAPVPLSELGEHICSRIPAIPPPKGRQPSYSDRSSHLPSRLQNVVPRTSSESSRSRTIDRPPPPPSQYRQNPPSGPPSKSQILPPPSLRLPPPSQQLGSRPNLPPVSPGRAEFRHPSPSPISSSSRGPPPPSPNNERMRKDSTPNLRQGPPARSGNIPHDPHGGRPSTRPRADSTPKQFQSSPRTDGPQTVFSNSSYDSLHEGPNAGSGGSAGFAGVGRRGFAAAQALMTPSPTSTFAGQQFLDVNTNRSRSASVSPTGTTFSSQSRTPSPGPSPLRAHLNAEASGSTLAPTSGGYRSPSVSPRPGLPPLSPRNIPIPRSPMSPERPQAVSPPSPPRAAPAKSRHFITPSEEFPGGLAYADDDESVAELEVNESVTRSSPIELRMPPKSAPAASRANRESEADRVVISPGFDSLSRTISSANTTPTSSSTSRRRSSERRTMTSVSSYSHDSEPDEERKVEPKMRRSKTLAWATLPPPPSRNNAPKRSLTSPSTKSSFTRDETAPPNGRATNALSVKKKEQHKECNRCRVKISDGRWIPMDSNSKGGTKGGVLCENCWKRMYLPRCRRCDNPIEKKAISSSDGQLKGKYHPECFNCNICHEKFPSGKFYVHSGHPLCAYHYHEANKSLCAAPHCGRPIEGPCAISHNNARYHPAHLVCEFEAGCGEPLKGEYWEFGGRMLCERHARVEEDDAYGDKAQRRMTRFIELHDFDNEEDDEDGGHSGPNSPHTDYRNGSDDHHHRPDRY